MRLALALTLLAAVLVAGIYVAPRHKRWPVKALLDLDVSRIDWRPRRATVAELTAIPTPVQWWLGGPARQRLAGAEFQVYELRAVVTGMKLHPDGDYNIVIADLADHRQVMTVEIPEPHRNPKFAACFAQARQAVDLYLSPPTSAMRWIPPTPVIVTGVGFFDRRTADQVGPSPNGIELHPVLEISFQNMTATEARSHCPVLN